jgi:hypothetical protein
VVVLFQRLPGEADGTLQPLAVRTAGTGNLALAAGKGMGKPAFRIIQTHFAAANNVGDVAAKEEVTSPPGSSPPGPRWLFMLSLYATWWLTIGKGLKTVWITRNATRPAGP